MCLATTKAVWIVLAGLIIGVVLAMPGDAKPPQEESLAAAHEAAKWRRRRIIMNNDGNDLSRLEADAAVTPEVFLSRRTTPLVGSHVDSIFYCTGVFNLYTHQSDETELLDSPKAAARNVYKLIEQGTDSLRVMTEFGRKHGIEVFWSMRMNDTHDASKACDFLFCEWKKNHPELLVGKRGIRYPYGMGRWSSVDYNLAEVRDKVFRILKDVCSRYDIDGIELDFFRHPVIFKEQMTGQPITDAQREKLTDLVRRIRKMTQEVAVQRGRPLLIAVRVPDSLGYCKAIGLDLEAWLKQRLVDMVTGGGYFKLTGWDYLVALGKEYDVPVYACLVRRRIEASGKKPEGSTAIQIWRGEAHKAWRAGVNGIYTFNRFDPNDAIFRELGDPKLLAKLERHDQTVLVNPKLWSKPSRWLKGGNRFVVKQKHGD